MQSLGKRTVASAALVGFSERRQQLLKFPPRPKRRNNFFLRRSSLPLLLCGREKQVFTSYFQHLTCRGKSNVRRALGVKRSLPSSVG